MEYVQELYSMLRVKWRMRRMSAGVDTDDEDLRFCYDILRSVSRSFALVIMQLGEGVRDAVCLFYLILRALDTVEDDMRLPAERKLAELPAFHEHLCDAAWRMSGVGSGRERELLERFPHVTRAFTRLCKAQQTVIADICARMAAGMCEFLSRGVETTADYNLYCHYVAGLVGHGLTRLFVAGGLEDARLADKYLPHANHMGLFLQKTNIIRDYYEDIRETPPRVFWPREIWGPYADDVGAFCEAAHEAQGLECLNAMVADALSHVPHVVEYISALRDPSVFAFCAIPQVMAMATLSVVSNNRDVFRTKVKVSRGTTARIFCHATALDPALRMMRTFAQRIADQTNAGGASKEKIRAAVGAALSAVDAHLRPGGESVARAMLTRYPALGGQLLYRLLTSSSIISDNNKTDEKTEKQKEAKSGEAPV